MTLLEQQIFAVAGAIEQIKQGKTRYCCCALATVVDKNSDLLPGLQDHYDFTSLTEAFRLHANPPFDGPSWWHIDDSTSRIAALESFLAYLKSTLPQ